MIFAQNEYAKKSGIYKITNSANERIYIGSGLVLKKRFQGHLRALLKGNHPNAFLQSDFNKCGVEAFVFDVVEIVEQNQLRYREQKWIDRFYDKQIQCYNLKPKVSLLVKRHSSNNPMVTKELLYQAAQKKAATHVLKNPNGELQKIVNLSRFARENGYNKSEFVKLLNGKKEHYRGWTRPETILKDVQNEKREAYWASLSKTYDFVDPTGQVVSITNLRKFCRENGYHSSNFNSLLQGKIKSCYGFQTTHKIHSNENNNFSA